MLGSSIYGKESEASFRIIKGSEQDLRVDQSILQIDKEIKLLELAKNAEKNKFVITPGVKREEP